MVLSSYKNGHVNHADLNTHKQDRNCKFGPQRHKTWKEKECLKSVQSALSDLKRPPERLQSQCNYRLFIT